jgi:cell division protein FtsI/penicillin-binding protein 2
LPAALYLAPLVVAAIGALWSHGGSPPQSLEVASAEGGELMPSSQRPVAEPANLGPPSAVFGDARLAGQLDLSRRRLEGDHFVVPLPDGREAILTLDPALQARAEALLAQSKAPRAGIVMMAPDGRLLALAGREGGRADPMVAVWAWAPSASVFKVVTAAALIDAGVNPDSRVCYHGGIHSIERDNLSDGPLDHTCQDLGYAIARSQNAIIAKMTLQHLDRARLAAMATRFGLGTRRRFALDAELGSIDLPRDDDELELARSAAGFWHTRLSPLGGAVLAATVGTRGLGVTPQIVAGVRDADGDVTPIPVRAPARQLSARTAGTVAHLMASTTEMGTAYKAFHGPGGARRLGTIITAGKTGSLSDRGPAPGTNLPLAYSWFVGFAPVDEPQVVVAVLLGNSSSWRFKAHTLARVMLEGFFRPGHRAQL